MFRPRGVGSLAVRPGLWSTVHTARAWAPGSAVHHRLNQRAQAGHPPSRAWETTAASSVTNQGDVEKGKEDGHIGVKSNESVLFFDSKDIGAQLHEPTNAGASDLFPISLSSFLNRVWNTDRDMAQLLERFESSSLGLMDPIRLVKAAFPGDVSMKVTEILPRLKDGGAFVKFRHDAALDPVQAEGETARSIMKC